MVFRILLRLAAPLLASVLVPLAGMRTLSQPVPAPSPSARPVSAYESRVSDEAVSISAAYGSFGGSGNPYGSAPAGYSGTPVLAGSFSDQLPVATATALPSGPAA